MNFSMKEGKPRSSVLDDFTFKFYVNAALMQILRVCAKSRKRNNEETK